MIIDTMEINGFKFHALIGVFGAGDGIVVEPETAQLDNPDYISALKHALLVCELAERYYWILHKHILESRHIKQFSDDEIQKGLETCNQVLSGEIYAFPKETTIEATDIRADLMREQERRREVERKRRKPRPGFVYLLREVNGPHYKIGRAKTPNNRRQTFEVKIPYRVEYEAVIPAGDMFRLESELQARYAHKRVDGEWFVLEPEDVAYIKSLAQEQA